jgi:hypothetical protein
MEVRESVIRDSKTTMMTREEDVNGFWVRVRMLDCLLALENRGPYRLWEMNNSMSPLQPLLDDDFRR